MPIEVGEPTIDIVADKQTFSVCLGRASLARSTLTLYGFTRRSNCLAASFKVLRRTGRKTCYTWPLFDSFFLGCQPSGVDFYVSSEEFTISGLTSTESCFDNGG